MANEQQGSATEIGYLIARTIAVSAAVFALLVCALMTVNHLQARASAPLDLPALEALRAALRERPADEALRNQIRALDLLARRAYFSSVDFARAGAWLLLGAGGVLLAALNAAVLLKARLPAPGKYGGPADLSGQWHAARWLTAALGGALGAAGLVLALRVPRVAYPAGEPAVAAPPAAAAPAAEARRPSREERLRNWPFFRGPDGNGLAYHTRVPTNWDGAGGVGIRWKSAVPAHGFSSPIVWSNRLFLTGGAAGRQEVYAFDAETGALQWRHAVNDVPGSPAEPPEVTADTGYAAPTPATDGQGVYAIFATGDLVGLTTEGRRRWARNLGLPDNPYGHSSSLILYEDLLLVQFDHSAEARALALEAASGREVWSARRSHIAWGSPICVNTGDRDELILTCSTGVDAYDPRSGRRLWGEACLDAEVGTSAAYAGGLVFVGNEFSLASAIRIGRGESEPPSSIVWQYADDLPDVASPLATDEYVFLTSSGGVVTCLRARTGEVLWTHSFDEGFYASPILAESRVYALDRSGVMHVFDAGPAYAPRGECPLGEPSACTPAFVGGRIYLRGNEHLFCVEEAAEGSAAR